MKKYYHLDNYSIPALYYRLRALRGFNYNDRRAIYRRIAVQKKRLIDSGVDAELVRLYCRSLASCDRAAEGRYRAYSKKIGVAL